MNMLTTGENLQNIMMNKRNISTYVKNVLITIGIIVGIIIVVCGKMWYSYERREHLKEIRRQNGEDWINGKYDY